MNHVFVVFAQNSFFCLSMLNALTTRNGKSVMVPFPSKDGHGTRTSRYDSRQFGTLGPYWVLRELRVKAKLSSGEGLAGTFLSWIKRPRDGRKFPRSSNHRAIDEISELDPIRWDHFSGHGRRRLPVDWFPASTCLVRQPFREKCRSNHDRDVSYPSPIFGGIPGYGCFRGHIEWKRCGF